MTRIQVTSAHDNTIMNGDRVIVRNSSGIPYVVVEDTTDGAIEVWKGNSTTPTAFTEQDVANRPASAGRYGSPSAAIDSTNIIHIVYGDDNGATPACRYVTFNTASGTYAGDSVINADLGADMTSIANIQTAIAIDSNDIPHICIVGTKKTGPTDFYTVYYNNRIGGAWNASMLEVYGGSNGEHAWHPHLAIDSNNKPFVSLFTNGLVSRTFLADANDPTNFGGTGKYFVHADLDRTMDLAVDGDGNQWLTYMYYSYPTNFVCLQEHMVTGSWASWEPETNDGDDGYDMSLAINDTDCYVLYCSYSGGACVGISYNKYNGSWLGEGLIIAADAGERFNNVKTKWAEYVDRDSTGTDRGGGGNRQEIDYVFADESASPDIWWYRLSLVGTTIYATLTDTVGITDTLSRMVEFIRTITDTLGITTVLSTVRKKLLSGVVTLYFKLKG